MATENIGMLPSLRQQNLLAEFAGLKQSCPPGIFVSLTPGDPSLWSGVIFVRKGPYATAILRFCISFPATYPALPPLVTFSTDIFHPLITPLSTYMYTTDIQEGGTVSATDDERLPPGGFSLRHGFPGWFGRVGAAGTATPSFMDVHKREISTFEVLSYIRSSFDDENVLDLVPLEAAGNPGAWHAWRTHRGYHALPEGDPSARKPGEWNWEGVWEERVKKGIAASLSEPVLYGGVGGGDDTIRFLSMEDTEVETVKDNLYKTLGESARADPLAVPSANS
ncbi:hypothetical protein M406DRAFT_61441 [Cryphonectria parasitica EP155]|uniref:UBC core domain-containing protein n=1 Tax=Cryphonectria parasitica (strain ATCC 38755 / EP155) TaxID=660469 RepID=A0A9P4Y5Y9_CRYP1|nr:uncharacterized protein M406DRAFT_61441 [Cryphonectria parasitica EP155]KAF3767589.1 hypothetical protein M406DRAFT_61441 [Cryphonectria parasitica EP155]